MSAPAGAQQRGFLRLSDGSGAGWLVYARLPRHPALVTGDRVSVTGRLETPPGDAAEFAGFLASRGASGTLEARGLERIGTGRGALASVEHLRHAVDESLARALPEPEAGLATGILVGLRERVARPVADDFTTTGLTHVVAISGWNIALVAGIVTGLLRAAGFARRARSAVVIGAIGAYTVVAGAEASVVRAALMGGVVILAREGGRPAGAAGALALACVGLLLADPGMAGDVGLQLSLAATAGLLALGRPAEAAVRRLAPGGTPGWLVETLGVSLAAQLATLPLVLFHFGRLSLISPLANVLMAPIVPLAMLGAVLGAVGGPVVGIPLLDLLLVPVRLAAWLPLAAMVRGAGLLADVPFASLELPDEVATIGALTALLGLAAALRQAARADGGQGHDLDVAGGRWTGTGGPSDAAEADGDPARERTRRRRGLAVGALVSSVAVLALAIAPGSAGGLRISVLDVGQGDAILVESSEGPRMLVDGGDDPDLLVRRLDERIPLWDRRIDLVVVTHPHEDHVGGLAGLMPRYRVDRVAETGLQADGPGMRELRAVAARHGTPRVRLGQGDAFALGSARVDVLWPPREAVLASPRTNREVNDTSIVLAIRLRAQQALLLGDLEEDRDAQLLAAIGPTTGGWDLLKVAHHGSATATSALLLAAVRPRLAAISVGAGNDYGHPAPSLLERLHASGATVWRTDRQGTLSVAFDGLPATATGRAAITARDPSGRAGTAWLARSGRDGTPRPAIGLLACYPRPDDRPDPRRSPGAPPLRAAIRAPPAARHGRGRGGRLPGLSRAARGADRGPPARGGRRAPARRGQGSSRRRSAPGARPRRCRGRLAARRWTCGAVARGRLAPGHAAGSAGCWGVGAQRTTGGAHRVLRGQAGHPARRLPRAAFRALAASPSRVRRSAHDSS
jgi:competence protein ComEC